MHISLIVKPRFGQYNTTKMQVFDVKKEPRRYVFSGISGETTFLGHYNAVVNVLQDTKGDESSRLYQVNFTQQKSPPVVVTVQLKPRKDQSGEVYVSAQKVTNARSEDATDYVNDVSEDARVLVREIIRKHGGRMSVHFDL